jgi:hypothetical protein
MAKTINNAKNPVSNNLGVFFKLIPVLVGVLLNFQPAIVGELDYKQVYNLKDGGMSLPLQTTEFNNNHN